MVVDREAYKGRGPEGQPGAARGRLMLVQTFTHKEPGPIGDEATFMQVGTVIVVISCTGCRIDVVGPVVNEGKKTSSRYYFRDVRKLNSDMAVLDAEGLYELYEKFVSYLPDSLHPWVNKLLFGPDK